MLIGISIYLSISILFMIYLLGSSGTIGKLWEFQEFKRNIPVGSDWIEAILSTVIIIPLYIIVRILEYDYKRRSKRNNSNPIKLEVGKIYVTKDGQDVAILNQVHPDTLQLMGLNTNLKLFMSFPQLLWKESGERFVEGLGYTPGNISPIVREYK